MYCRSCMESIESLFFDCGYSKRLWQELMRKNLVLDPPSTWPEIIRA